MAQFNRLLRHLFGTRSQARKLFPRATLQAVQAGIAAGEKQHRAEIRCIVEAALPLSAVLRGESSRARAHELFSHYRIWDTEENCGILIYINVADHKVEILPDRTVDKVLKRDDWHAVCQTMTRGFAGKKYHDSLLQALTQLNALLAEHFPDQDKHRNQLSDRPLML
ncbi:TPM domain-containing protein [Herbaspirillum rhizosphaerae]|uniref:TPM domain-containing protein n=1 Tax=Herbaspirillum rhizosphaerae TaxID=346179 RepID=UPI00067C0CFE|nr:TPM domain-containing protein [Herbaspirillum rhizosphaerae]